MNRLRQPGDSHYDVLGVTPDATDQEISGAFARLIDGEGYRVGVPLNRQWLRARKIKDAYAVLADPAERRAYDESLETPDQAPWAMTANDPGTDELVLPESGPVAAERVDHELPGLDPSLDDDRQISAPALNDNEPASARKWGVAAAVTIGLAALLIGAWPGWNRQSPTAEEIPAAIAPASVDDAPAAGADQQPAGELQALSDTPGRPSDRQAASDEAPMQEMGELAASSESSGRPQPVAMPPTSPPAAGASSPQAGLAQAPPAATDAPAIAAPPVAAERADPVVRTPAQWIGGGPTDADNRSGRYQGTVAVQVNVDPDGRVSSCAAVQGSGNAGLDALTCRLVQERARFAPALDAQGRPVAGQAYTTFVWGRRRPR